MKPGLARMAPLGSGGASPGWSPVVMPAGLPPWKLLPRPGSVYGPYPLRATEPPSPRLWQAWLQQRLRQPPAAAARRRRNMLATVEAHLDRLDRADAHARQQDLRRLRIELRRNGFLDTLTAQAFAHVAWAVRGAFGFRLFPTQYLAAWTMLGNCLIEMATGEGKSQAVLLTAATAALAGVPVHVCTSNDYLAERDARQMQPVLAELGLSVGCVTGAADEAARRAAYACDLTYATAREVVFDFLRDRLGAADPLAAAGHGTPVLRGLCMAVLDEADSVLIDEAGTPMILSQVVRTANDSDNQRLALYLARQLRPGEDTVESPDGNWSLTEAGRTWLALRAAQLGGNWRLKRFREEMVMLALAALHRFRRDVDYVVHDEEIQIVDVHTGRRAEGRAWSRGLHQMVGLKEGLKPAPDTDTVMQITYQQFFPRYLRLCGLSGTLAEARGELLAVYGLPVLPVPLRRPGLRDDGGTRVHAEAAHKWAAVVERTRVLAAAGRCVLVGTGSVADSEHLSALLAARGVRHQVLNARQDAEEARIVAQGGQTGTVTVATQMAGRGTDIPLGEGVAALGGLHVINACVQPARRIDRQLAGRAGRQGQPGSCERIVSLDEELLRQSLPPRLLGLLAAALRLGPLAGCANAAVWWVQHRCEARMRSARWGLLQHENWLAKSLAWAGRHEWD